MPRMTAGRPSSRNSQRQPAMPRKPSICKISPETIEANAMVAGMPHNEERIGARPARAREPIGQVKEDAGKESGLRRTHQGPNAVEAPLAGDKHGRCGGKTPGDHNARDPEPRPDFASIRLLGISNSE